MKKALILIDMQMDYFEGGAMHLPESDTAVHNAGMILKKFRDDGDTVVHITQQSPKEVGFLIADTPGIEIHSTVAPHENEISIVKHTPNAFHDTNLHEVLIESGITELTVVGFMANMCIDSTVRRGKELGYVVAVVPEAIAACGIEDVTASQVKDIYLSMLSLFFAQVVALKDIQIKSGQKSCSS
ncbi:MAG: isochorismatase family protein [Fibrobacterales bacterium]